MIENRKIFTSLLWILNILLLLYLIILARFNRLSQDDYGFLSWTANKDVFDFVKTVYSSHQGRYVSFFFHWFQYRFIELSGLFQFFPLINYAIGAFAIFLIAKRLFGRKYALPISFLLMSVIVMINFEFCSFYWICASRGIMSFAWIVFLWYFIFKANIKWLSYLGIIVVSIIIGGSSEAFSPLVLYLLFMYSIYVLWQNKFHFMETLQNEYIVKIITAAIIICIGTYLVISAPGNANRIAQYEQPSIFGAFVISLKNVALFSYFLAFKLPYILLCCIVVYIYGMKYSTKKLSLGTKEFLYTFVTLITFIWLNTIPAAWAMGGFGFHRIYTISIVMTLFFCVFWCYIAGQKNLIKNFRSVYDTGVCLIFIFCCVQMVNICIDSKTAYKYNKSDIERINLLLEEKTNNRTEPLYLEPLYTPLTFNCKSVILRCLFNNDKNPMIYYSNEIEPTIEYNSEKGFSNRCLMRYYELPFSIYLKQD